MKKTKFLKFEEINEYFYNNSRTYMVLNFNQKINIHLLLTILMHTKTPNDQFTCQQQNEELTTLVYSYFHLVKQIGNVSVVFYM